MSGRVRPNLLITGTPGVGKTLLAARLGQQLDMAVINVGQFAKERECLGAWDEVYQSHELEEDKLLVTLLEIWLRIIRQAKESVVLSIYLHLAYTRVII